MSCYRSGGCGIYEMYSCNECPYSKPPEEKKDNTYKIGLKEVKFCKYCGSSNILPSKSYYKHFNCLNCGSEFN